MLIYILSNVPQSGFDIQIVCIELWRIKLVTLVFGNLHYFEPSGRFVTGYTW